MFAGYINSFRNLSVYYYTVDLLISKSINRYESALVVMMMEVMMLQLDEVAASALSTLFSQPTVHHSFTSSLAHLHGSYHSFEYILSSYLRLSIAEHTYPHARINPVVLNWYKYFRLTFRHCMQYLTAMLVSVSHRGSRNNN